MPYKAFRPFRGSCIIHYLTPGSLRSPGGRLLLYQSESSGKWEWYVRTISRDASLGRAIQITTDGGEMFWRKPVRADGFWDLIHVYKDWVYRVTITADPGRRVAKREIIGESEGDLIAFDQLPDGRVLAVIRGDDEIDEHTSMTVVLNWTTELRRRSLKRDALRSSRFNSKGMLVREHPYLGIIGMSPELFVPAVSNGRHS